MKKQYIIPIFVPHLGCSNACTFCNQRSISGQTKMVTAQDVKDTIEYYLSNFKDDNKYVEVAFFGGSFTGIDETNVLMSLFKSTYNSFKLEICSILLKKVKLIYYLKKNSITGTIAKPKGITIAYIKAR